MKYERGDTPPGPSRYKPRLAPDPLDDPVFEPPKASLPIAHEVYKELISFGMPEMLNGLQQAEWVNKTFHDYALRDNDRHRRIVELEQVLADLQHRYDLATIPPGCERGAI